MCNRGNMEAGSNIPTENICKCCFSVVALFVHVISNGFPLGFWYWNFFVYLHWKYLLNILLSRTRHNNQHHHHHSHMIKMTWSSGHLNQYGEIKVMILLSFHLNLAIRIWPSLMHIRFFPFQTDLIIYKEMSFLYYSIWMLKNAMHCISQRLNWMDEQLFSSEWEAMRLFQTLADDDEMLRNSLKIIDKNSNVNCK